jgi:hypothetical protein
MRSSGSGPARLSSPAFSFFLFYTLSLDDASQPRFAFFSLINNSRGKCLMIRWVTPRNLTSDAVTRMNTGEIHTPDRIRVFFAIALFVFASPNLLCSTSVTSLITSIE